MEQRDLGEIFLVNFLQSIATVSKFSSGPEEAIENKSTETERKKNMEMLPEGIKEIKNTRDGKKVIEINQHNNFRQSNQLKRFSSNFNNQKFQKTARAQQQFQNIELNQKSASEKLSFLIKDPAVTEIECIGSEQNILVKKAGVIQKTPIKLSIEEVYELIAEFSQKTKIPVIDGTIKAALNNLILTAVLSEMLGPRFILQKKNPFQQLIKN